MDYNAKTLTTSSILASLAVISEVIGGLIPGVGVMIGGFSTLFVALAGSKNRLGGIFTYMVSALLIGFILPAKLPLFLLNRGLLGLVMGITFNLGPKKSVTAAALFLTLGTFTLASLLGIPLPGFTEQATWPLFPYLAITSYSLLLSYLWYLFISRLKMRFHQI